MYRYLTGRKNSQKIFSKSSPIEYDVPQGSIFGPLSIKITVCDMLVLLTDFKIPGYTDDHTPQVCYDDIKVI